MTSSLRLLASALFLATAVGCQPQAAPAPVPGEMPKGGTVIATVDGHEVTQEMVDLTIKQLPPQLRTQLEQSGQLSQVKEQVIVGEVLYRKAIERKLHEDPDVSSTLALASRSALADALLTKDKHQLDALLVSVTKRPTPNQLGRCQYATDVVLTVGEDDRNGFGVVRQISNGVETAGGAKALRALPAGQANCLALLLFLRCLWLGRK